MPELNVIKADGRIVPFDIEKVRRSLRRARVGPDVIEIIADRVGGRIYEGMSTSEIYEIAFSELKSHKRNSAGKYSLKKAIFQMGPTGFPFEKLIGSLFETEGFTTSTGQIVKGRCISHEVDVVAEKGDLHYDVECKFHSFQGRVCDVKHALYVHARFVDIGKELESKAPKPDREHKGWLVTNTRMTSDAIAFGTCAGLGLLSWDYPPETSLRERIDSSGLHPITCLTTLSVKLKRQLLEKGIITCRDLIAGPRILLELRLSQTKIDEVIDEAYEICESP